MKLPKYMKLKFNEKNYNFTLTIKKWGMPFLLFKVLKERYKLKWYHWVTLYPYACIKIIWGGCNG